MLLDKELSEATLSTNNEVAPHYVHIFDERNEVVKSQINPRVIEAKAWMSMIQSTQRFRLKQVFKEGSSTQYVRGQTH